MRSNALRLAWMVMALTVPASSALAQSAAQALADANSRAACGSGTPVSAEYLPGGALSVTCRAAPQGLPQTGLAPGTAAGVLAAAAALAVIANDDGGAAGTTTTTTTTTTTAGD
ncbi:hypothetical protein ACOHWE_11510 [Cribrihabitans neustonicus]